MDSRYFLESDPTSFVQKCFPDVVLKKECMIQANSNLRPKDLCPVVLTIGESIQLLSLQWGLIFSWSAEDEPKLTPIHATAETLLTKNTFKPSFRQKRCVVLMTSFFATRKSKGKDGAKITYRYFLKGVPHLLAAGLWNTKIGARGPIQSFAIVTTAANKSVKDVHERMPVILNKESANDWLANGRDPMGYNRLFRSDAQPLFDKELTS